MKNLFLIRHAKSSWDTPNLDDADRPLNTRGNRDAPIMAQRMASNWPVPELIFCSRAKRARETADILKRFWWKEKEIKVEGELYDASASDVLNFITDAPDAVDSMAFVFHNPTITFLSNILTYLEIPNVPTCGIVSLRAEVNEWKEIEPGKCELLDFDFPKREH